MKLSVQIPLYFTEKYIETTLRSVMLSAPDDAEIYVYDDASPDNSYEIASQVASEDSRIRLERVDKNTVGEITYWMIENTDAEYIATFDCDDIMIPGFLNRAVAMLDANPEAIAVYGKDLQASPDQDGIWNISGQFGYEMSYFRMAYSNIMSRGTIFIRRDLLLKTDYRERTKMVDGSDGTATDYMIASNLLRAGKILFIDDYAMIYRRHKESESSRAGAKRWHESQKSVQKSGLKKYGPLVKQVLETGKLQSANIPSVLFCLGIMCNNRQYNDPELEKLLLLSEQIAPSDYYIQLCMSQIYMLNNQPEKAIQHYYKFLKTEIYNPHIFSLAAKVNELFTEHGIEIPENNLYRQKIIAKTQEDLAFLSKKIKRINSSLHTDFRLKI